MLHDARLLKAAAHITGGGITDNLPRVLPKGTGAEIDTSAWPELPVFTLLKKLGNMPEDDYRRTFNTGIGMALVVGEKKAAKAVKLLEKAKEQVFVIGRITKAGKGAKVAYK